MFELESINGLQESSGFDAIADQDKYSEYESTNALVNIDESSRVLSKTSTKNTIAATITMHNTTTLTAHPLNHINWYTRNKMFKKYNTTQKTINAMPAHLPSEFAYASTIALLIK